MEIDDTQNRWLGVARDCIAVRVRLINRVVSGIFDEELRHLGLKASQMNILVALSVVGSAKPGDICSLLHLDPSTLSRNVERMRKKNWLEIVPVEDGRTHLLAVGPEGRMLLEEAYPAWARAQEKATAILGESGVGAVQEVGDRLLGMQTGKGSE